MMVFEAVISLTPPKLTWWTLSIRNGKSLFISELFFDACTGFSSTFFEFNQIFLMIYIQIQKSTLDYHPFRINIYSFFFHFYHLRSNTRLLFFFMIYPVSLKKCTLLLKNQYTRIRLMYIWLYILIIFDDSIPSNIYFLSVSSTSYLKYIGYLENMGSFILYRPKSLRNL